MKGLTTRMRRRMPAHPSTVGAARRLVRSALADADRGDLAENAELLLSEVVTNAVVHAATDVDVEAVADEGGVRVEVSDGSAHLPAARAYGPLSGTGRGLRMLDQLADAWGVNPHPWGKTVWFELHSGGGTSSGAEGRPDVDGHRGSGGKTASASVVDVLLLNVPLLMHAAWQVHAESLLREYLLLRLDDESDAVAELEAHAAVNDAMSLLREHLPAPAFGDDPAEALAERSVTADRVTLPVPRESVANFRLLDDTLEAVATLADAGALLTAPSQPEVRMMRRWLCRQVTRQARGEEPVAWDGDQELAPAPVDGHAWEPELAEVTGSTRPLVAADDRNRILAVSGAAVVVLGCGSAAALVGHRLVEIVPRRFRQAHLAGFTLHLSTGRSPLLGHPVTVPALRHDGTETTVELTVTVHQRDGRSLFVAELRPVS